MCFSTVSNCHSTSIALNYTRVPHTHSHASDFFSSEIRAILQLRVQPIIFDEVFSVESGFEKKEADKKTLS